jgi:hypothetical protein
MTSTYVASRATVMLGADGIAFAACGDPPSSAKYEQNES